MEGQPKNLTLKIPQGIRDGEKIRLIGQGKPGRDGGKSGDLLIKVKVKDDNKFKLKGCDLYTDILLTPWEAALGTRAIVQSIDDETKVYIPQGIQSGEKIRIPNKGYQSSKTTRGDLVAEIKIVVPKQLTQQEEKIFRVVRNHIMDNFDRKITIDELAKETGVDRKLISKWINENKLNLGKPSNLTQDSLLNEIIKSRDEMIKDLEKKK